MTDDQYNEILPEITEADAQTILEAAGEIAERPAADLRDALEILAGDDPEPLEYIRICLAFNAESTGDQERHDALLKRVHERQREQLGQEYDAIIEAAGRVRTIMRDVKSATDAAIEPVRAISEVIESIKTLYQSFALAIDDALPEWARDGKLEKFYDELDALEPFIEAEIQKRPGMEGKNLNDVLMSLPFRVVYYAQRGEKAPETVAAAEDINVFVEIIQAARQARRDAEKDALPNVTYKKKHDLALTIGKSSFRLFNPLNYPTREERKQVPGQMSFIPVRYEAEGKDEITLFCGITENSLLSALDAEDYFYLSFIGDAYLAGNKTITVSKLYKDYMGVKPSPVQKTDFVKKLERLAGTQVRINDRQVRDAWNLRDPNAKYKEVVQQAAPIAIGSEHFVANGQVTEATIKIYDFPAILKVDYDINQYTTVPKSLVQVRKYKDGKPTKYVSRTKRFYKVLQYLIRRIAQMKSGKGANRLLYSTFYDEMGETSTSDRKRARDCLWLIIEHFKHEGWITEAIEEPNKAGENGITFKWNAAPAAGKKPAAGKRIGNKGGKKPAADKKKG